MNFFEQELRKLFEDGSVIRSPWFSGNRCVGILDGGLRARAEFVHTVVLGDYNALRLTVLNRASGPVDTVDLNIKEVLNVSEYGLVIRYSDKKNNYTWQGSWPTDRGYQMLREATDGYLGVFREQTQEQDQAEHPAMGGMAL